MALYKYIKDLNGHVVRYDWCIYSHKYSHKTIMVAVMEYFVDIDYVR